MAHAAAHAPAHHAGHGHHPAPATAHSAPHHAEHAEHHEEHAGGHGHSERNKMLGIAFRLGVDFVGTALFINIVSLLCGITPASILRNHLRRWEVVKLGLERMWHAMHMSLGDVGMACVHNFFGLGGDTRPVENLGFIPFTINLGFWLFVWFIAFAMFKKNWLGGTMMVWAGGWSVYLVAMWAMQVLGPLGIVLLVAVFGGGAIIGLGWKMAKYLWNLAEDSGH